MIFLRIPRRRTGISDYTGEGAIEAASFGSPGGVHVAIMKGRFFVFAARTTAAGAVAGVVECFLAEFDSVVMKLLKILPS